jgi:hypothetical protein
VLFWHLKTLRDWGETKVQIEGLIIGQDIATAGFGLANAGYFAGQAAIRTGRTARRIAAAAMVLVSASASSEAAFSQSMLWSGDAPDATWALARLPLLAATTFVSVLIVRRITA